MTFEDIIQNKKYRLVAGEEDLMFFSLFYFGKYHKYKIPQFHKDWYKDLNDPILKAIMLIGFRECGKRQPLDAHILTPDGWTTMGELKVGDYVIGSDGKQTKVVYMSEIVGRPVYKIRTEDGRETECDEEHLWTVRKMTGVKNKHETIDVKEILNRGLYYPRFDKRNNKEYKEYKFALETVKPIEFSEKDFIIDPYILGTFLGNGCSSRSSLSFHSQDSQYYRDVYSKFYNIADNTSRSDNGSAFIIYDIYKDLDRLNLRDKHSYDKFIPKEYLFGSIEQRKALLEGLMDTDGTNGNGTANYSTSSEELCNDVVSLVRSLGGRASVASYIPNYTYKCKKLQGRKSYRIHICFTDYIPFRIPRKRDKYKLSRNTFSRIVSIEKSINKLGRCIKVENEDGLYITNDYLLTHNTSLVKIKLMHDICYKKKNFIIWTSKDKKKAEANLFDIALELQTNKRLIADFGQLFYEDNIDDKFSKKKSIGEFITTNKIKVKAYSTSQSPRGEVYQEFRPDLVVLDDYENLETIDSEAYTEEVIHYIDELLSGLGNTAQIISLSNRLTFGGSVSYLEDRLKTIPNCKIYDIPVVNKETGAINWPDKYVMTDKEADEINATIENKDNWKVSLESKERLLGYQVYNREMLNTPMTDSEREFKPQWYQYRTREELSAYKTRKFLSIDTAMGEKEVNDFTGITEIFVDSEGFWTISAKRYKLNPNDLVNLIFNLYATNGYERIGIEKTTFTEGLKPYIQQQMRERGLFLPLVELSHGGTKKETRIRGLIPMYSNRAIFHLVGECSDLESEQQQFPRSKHDDVLDSLAYCIQLLGSNPKPQQRQTNVSQNALNLRRGFTNNLK
jgi:phage terminase large subunit-like protein